MNLLLATNDGCALVDILNDKIPFEAIMRGLARERWGHQFKTGICLAAHQILVSTLYERRCETFGIEPTSAGLLACLTHDLGETLVGEHPRHLKRNMTLAGMSVDDFEHKLMPNILRSIGFSEQVAKEVLEAQEDPNVLWADEFAGYVEALHFGPNGLLDFPWWDEHKAWAESNDISYDVHILKRVLEESPYMRACTWRSALRIADPDRATSLS